MSLLSTITSAFASDPYPRALERLTQARAGLATAKARSGDGTAQREARAKELEAYPHLRDCNPSDWSPAQGDAGEIEVAAAEDNLAAANVDFDSSEPRIEALRKRVRETCAQLADANNNPRIAAIRGHVEALASLGIKVADLASAAAQREIGDALGRIADDHNTLRAERQREGLPAAYLFSVERVEACAPLRNLGVSLCLPVIDGLRQAAYASALTVETLTAVCVMLGTMPAPLSAACGSRMYEINRRGAHWRETQDAKTKRVDARRQGLGY